MKYDLATHYLPHETPMVMIDKVHLVDDETCICSVNVSKHSILAPFLNADDTLPNLYAIELMAQTVGVWNGFHGIKSNHTARLGMLLGGRAIKMSLNAFPTNSELLIHAKLVLADSKLANFDCQIRINENCVATGKLNVYEPDEEELAHLFGSKRLGE